mmetsp:Transcript_6998/g.14339  ORF Transcript_6998/g.14339 Transcript_6998/m.14339 type:complete len:361 (-) Transcript_6998:20-1102(-)
MSWIVIVPSSLAMESRLFVGQHTCDSHFLADSNGCKLRYQKFVHHLLLLLQLFEMLFVILLVLFALHVVFQLRIAFEIFSTNFASPHVRFFVLFFATARKIFFFVVQKSLGNFILVVVISKVIVIFIMIILPHFVFQFRLELPNFCAFAILCRTLFFVSISTSVVFLILDLFYFWVQLLTILVFALVFSFALLLFLASSIIIIVVHIRQSNAPEFPIFFFLLGHVEFRLHLPILLGLLGRPLAFGFLTGQLLTRSHLGELLLFQLLLDARIALLDKPHQRQDFVVARPFGRATGLFVFVPHGPSDAAIDFGVAIVGASVVQVFPGKIEARGKGFPRTVKGSHVGPGGGRVAKVGFDQVVQ